MSGAAESQILKGVSRSFFLSLRLLPSPMRNAASLAYLLARSSDTLADAAAVPVARRLDALLAFADSVATGSLPPSWPQALLDALPDPRERHLLERVPALLIWLHGLPAAIPLLPCLQLPKAARKCRLPGRRVLLESPDVKTEAFR